MSNDTLLVLMAAIMFGIFIHVTIKMVKDVYNSVSYKVIKKNPEELLQYLGSHYYGFKGVEILLVQPRTSFCKNTTFSQRRR